MADLQTRLNALEQQMHTVARRPRRGDPAQARHPTEKRPRDPFEDKPRQNFVYLSADLSRAYRVIVTLRICIRGLPPGRSLILALWGVVAGEAGLNSTRSSELRTEVKVILARAVEEEDG